MRVKMGNSEYLLCIELSPCEIRFDEDKRLSNYVFYLVIEQQ